MLSAGKDMEQRALSLVVGGNAKMVQPLQKTAWQFLTKVDIGLPSDPWACSYIFTQLI